MFCQRLLVCFENRGDSLEAVGEWVRMFRGGCDMCYHQAGCAFIENEFTGADDSAEAAKQALD